MKEKTFWSWIVFSVVLLVSVWLVASFLPAWGPYGLPLALIVSYLVKDFFFVYLPDTPAA